MRHALVPRRARTQWTDAASERSNAALAAPWLTVVVAGSKSVLATSGPCPLQSLSFDLALLQNPPKVSTRHGAIEHRISCQRSPALRVGLLHATRHRRSGDELAKAVRPNGRANRHGAWEAG
eukprot:4662089-Prymnesium_polylepis.1